MDKNKQKGIALFIAVITTSALFLIALAIADISYKEQVISQSGSQSKIAFYAADSGTECALYHDLKAPDGFFFAASETTGITEDFQCNGSDTEPETEIQGSAATTTFSYNVSDDPKSCVVVLVGKRLVGSNVVTTIESRGYNNHCTAQRLPEESNRNLERTIRTTY